MTPWYETGPVWTTAAALTILVLVFLASHMAYNLGLERGVKQAGKQYRARLAAAERERAAAWELTRGPRPRIIAESWALGYPDAIQAMPPADSTDRTGPWPSGPWTTPRGPAEYGPLLGREAEADPPP